MFKEIGKQLKKPSGLLGRIVSKFMDLRNRKFYRKALIELQWMLYEDKYVKLNIRV